MKRIILFSDSFNSGGAQNQMVLLSNLLCEHGYSIKTLQYHDINFFSDNFNENIKNDKILSANKFIRIFKVINYLRKENPEVLISFLSGPNFHSFVYRLVFFFRKFTLITGERNHDQNTSYIRLLLKKIPHILSNYIVCNSHIQTEIIRKIFPKRKVKCIPNGLTVKFNENIKKRNYKNKKFIVVARFIDQKNPIGLLKALVALNRNDIRVDWYGEIFKNYSIFNESMQLINNNPLLQEIFRLKGERKNITEIFPEYSAMLLPSFYEGCPNVIMEAMITQTPIVASNISDNMRYLNFQRELLFDPNNIFEISEKINIFLNMSDEDIRSVCDMNFNIALENFSKDSILNSYNRLII